MDKLGVKKWFYDNVSGDHKARDQMWAGVMGAFAHAQRHHQPSRMLTLPLKPDGALTQVRFRFNKLGSKGRSSGQSGGFGVEVMPPDEETKIYGEQREVPIARKEDTPVMA